MSCFVVLLTESIFRELGFLSWPVYMSYLHNQLLRGLRANTDSVLYFMSPHCPNRVSRIKHSLNACELSCLVKFAMAVERSQADNLQIERPRDQMFRKGSTEQYNHWKMNKRHYKEASGFLLADTLWVLVTTNITISTESLSYPHGSPNACVSTTILLRWS